MDGHVLKVSLKPEILKLKWCLTVVVMSTQRQRQQQKCLYVKSPTDDRGVGYRDVIEEPSGEHSVHPAALNTQ